MSIHIHDVTKRFGSFTALDRVNLEVPSGQLLALLGPSGSGKTTLLRIIAGLESPDAGSIQYEDEDVTHVAPKDREVGFVFQHYALFRHMTVFENVAFGMRIGLQGPYKKVPTAEENMRLFRRNRPVTVIEPYYPGFFLQFNPKENSKNGQDSATVLIRANEFGQDITGPTLTQTGWYTFGMSVSPDAAVHYYIKPGVEDLTEADHITTLRPYGIPGTHFNTLFFNICSGDDGKTWSTPIVIDDPQIFYGQSPRPAQTAQRPQQPPQGPLGGLFNR